MRTRWLPVISILVVAVLGVTSCAPTLVAVEPTAAATEAEVQPPAPTKAGTPDPYPGWTTYTNATFTLSFRYPSTWFGPDVYEFEDGVRLEVGSDQVYPYGTGLEEREPGAPDAYHIVIQYTRNSAGWTPEQYRAEQPWFDEMSAVIDLQDGESITTARSLTTRQRSLAVGRFTGVEFITTLPDTAQTERVYMRTALLMDEGLNVLVVNGSPENVQVADPAAWRATFEAVDTGYREIFSTLVESIQVE
jgi:hypothetical protein